jgi:hypothetical protein
MRKLLIALVLTLAAGSPARAQEDAFIGDVELVGLEPNLRIVLRIDETGAVSFAPDGAADMAAIDRNALQAIGVIYDDPAKRAEAMGPNSVSLPNNGVAAAPLAAGIIRISMFAVTERDGYPGTLLVLENGYGQALRYRASMVRGRRSAPTDVCTVPPRLRGYEHWPYHIDRLDLTGFELVPYPEGTAPVCE